VAIQSPPKFIADAMLGRLVTWLRIYGFDTAYARTWPDDELVARALHEGRLILTRDTRLIQRGLVRNRHFFIRGDHYREQLQQVLDRFPPDPAHWLTRCLRCNRVLAVADKRSVSGRVPPYVYASQERFEICPQCGRIYWRATHAWNMRAQIPDRRAKEPKD
jgi:uncharacterized protein